MGKILKERGLTAYWLASETGLSLSVAYRLADDVWDQIPRATLIALCDVLKVEPADLFDYTAKR